MKARQPYPKFLFIQPENENIGIEYLSASLKKNNILVDLLFLPRPFNNVAIHFIPNQHKTDIQKIYKKIEITKPDIICFSPFTSQYLWTIKQACLIKKKYPKLTILCGGVHINSVPTEVIKNKYIDAIIIGEADLQIVEFAKYYYSPKLLKLPSVWIKRQGKLYKNPILPLVKNIDSLPFADKDIFYSQIPRSLRDTTYMIMGSRGCPFSCSYCSNNVYKKLYSGQNRLRFRSPENIITELQQAKDKYNFRMVEFFDDVLTINESRLKKLLSLYRRQINLPFTCYLHPQLVTQDIINLLKKSGCRWLKLGVQSANENYRKKYLQRYETNNDIIRASRWCNQYHLPFSLDHIFNLPGETEENLIEAVKLYNASRPTVINFGTLIYLPGTEIINHGLKFKNITVKDVKNINLGCDPVAHMSNIELFSHQSRHNRQINISVFAALFMIITIIPGVIPNLLIRLKIHRLNFRIPQFVLVFLKILAKIRARQIYLYLYFFKTFTYYLFRPGESDYYLNHQLKYS